MKPFIPQRQPTPILSQGKLNNSDHELAEIQLKMSTQRSASTRSSNFSPPPPVTASIYQPSASIRINRNAQIRGDSDDVLVLRRQEKALEDELQELLDAQSEGLFKVLGGGAVEDNGSSTGTSTPTLASGTRGRDMSPAERYTPRKKKPGLSGARRGIYKSIQRLAAVKTQEAALVATDLQENEGVLERIDAWDTKRERLTQKIERIEHASSTHRAQDIRREAQKLEAEIQELEEKLLEMRSRHRQLLDDAAATDNSLQSKLSSYKAALSMLDSDIESFLRRPPQKPTSSASRESNFLKLPSNRRTLGLARDHWNEEHASLEAKTQQITSVHATLSEGAAVWKDVIALVDRFEANLGIWLQHASTFSAPITGRSSNSKGKGRADTTSHSDSDSDDIIQKMDDVTDQLEYYVALAESKNWKLLVCCVGAELEAFKQAMSVLRESILGSVDGRQQTSSPGDALSEQEPEQHLLDSPVSESKPFEEQSPQRNRSDGHKLFDTDDEPDPDLLIERKDGTEYDSEDPGGVWRAM